MFPKSGPIPKLPLLLCAPSDLPYLQPPHTSLEFHTISPFAFLHTRNQPPQILLNMDPSTCPVCMGGGVLSCLKSTVVSTLRTSDIKASGRCNFCPGGSMLTRPDVGGGTVLTCRCVAENRWRTEPSAWQLTVSWDVSEQLCARPRGGFSSHPLGVLVHV